MTQARGIESAYLTHRCQVSTLRVLSPFQSPLLLLGMFASSPRYKGSETLGRIKTPKHAIWRGLNMPLDKNSTHHPDGRLFAILLSSSFPIPRRTECPQQWTACPFSMLCRDSQENNPGTDWVLAWQQLGRAGQFRSSSTQTRLNPFSSENAP